MPVACQSRAGTEPAGETQSLLLRQSKDRCIVRCSGLFAFLDAARMEQTVSAGEMENVGNCAEERE